jgi:chemotaxis protein methyltransferase CheR
MSDAFVQDLQRLVLERTGIVLGRERRDSIAKLCARRADELRLPGPEAYLQTLDRGGPDAAEFLSLLGALTNGETCFYRDQRQFLAVEALLAERGRTGGPMLHLWSAGCATGEEAYSLSIAASSVGTAAAVLGTDINPAYLAAAQEARYGERSLRNLPPPHRERYFSRDSGAFVATPDVRGRVRFQRGNLMDRIAPTSGRVDGRWDVILCRNVFIYFERKTVEAVVARLLRALAPEGHLFIGAAESLHGFDLEAVAVNVGGVWAYRAARPGEPHIAMPPSSAPAAAPERRAGAEAKRPAGRRGAEKRTSPHGIATFRGIRDWLAGLSRAQAREHLTQLLAHTPDHTKAHMYLGYFALQESDGAAALDRFQKAHEQDPLLPEVHYCLALAYRRLGDRFQLAEALRRTVFLAPRFWPALLMQAGLFREAGRHDLALATYRRILEVIGTRKGDQADMDLDLPDLEDVALYREEVKALCRKAVADLDPEIRSTEEKDASSRRRNGG